MACRQRCRVFLALALALWVTSVFANISLDPVITSGLNDPTFVTSPPGDDRLFVIERSGAIKVFNNNGSALGTFMTVPGVNASNEGGLLGLAFHRAFADNGFFVVSYTGLVGTLNPKFTTIIERFSVSSSNPNIGDANSGEIVLTVTQPQTNHNAGWIGFNPIDGYLYIPLGDGGGGHDPDDNGQDINTLLGSILRIEIDLGDDGGYTSPADNPFVNKDGADEIWAYGVRNPWRAGFDRQTGEFYFGDVGQHTWEEVNKGIKEGNFGWPLREGFVATPTGGVGGELSPREDPLHVYANPEVGRSVVGGVVYRGPVLALQGKYLFAEFYTGDIWRMDPDGSNVDPIKDDVAFTGTPIAFGEDDDGDVYVVDFNGRVLRFGGEVAMPSVTAVPTLPPLLFVLLALVLGAGSFVAQSRRG